VVEALGADAVDVNMGCPVPKIAKNNAGCSLMREPEHAGEIVAAMAKAVRIPVTVKMRAGWNEREVNAPDLAKRMEDAGAAAITVHGRTAAQSYGGQSDWDLIARVAAAVSVPVFGNGDCVEPGDLFARLRTSGVAGVLVGRGVLRNPWIFAQAAALEAGRAPREVSLEDRGRFLLDYMDLLLLGDAGEAAGFRHRATRADQAHRTAEEPAPSPAETAFPGPNDVGHGPARGRDRWVINKIRALSAWYTRGLDNGSHLRHEVNRASTLPQLRDLITTFFGCTDC
jgi:nifR3 family TIM-barrel protein